MPIIKESGLYALILSSKLDSAKRFKHWVTSEVLPAIRKHGMYAVDELLENPDIAIKAFTALKEERDKNKALLKDIQRMKPKEVFADAVSASHTSILIGDLAKLLKQNGYETGQKRLFEQLRQEGYLIKGGSSRNMPTQISMDMNLFEVKETSITNPDGSVRVTKTTKVTGKGQQYFINRYFRRTESRIGGKGQMRETEWRRLELTVSGEDEKERLERLIKEKNLSRQDLAVILFGLRVQPGFGKKDFGI